MIPQTCYFCGTKGRMINWSHWIADGKGKFGGHYIRVDYCNDCRGKIVRYKAPKKAPVKRQQTIHVGGDWALVGKFLGATKKS